METTYTQSEIRWGILSCARVARQRWIPAMQSIACPINAIASRSVDKATEWANMLCIPRAYGSYEELLADDEIDAVFIGLPNHLHHEWSIKALQAGKHVLCDKPLTLSIQEAKEMAKTAELSNRLLMEGFMYQFHPQYELIDQWIQEKAIGELKHVRASFCFVFDRPGDFRYNPSCGGGVILDLGCYCVNLVRRIAGEPTTVLASLTNHAEGADWNMSAIMQHGQVSSQIDCSFDYQGNQFLHIVGTKGMITTDRPFNTKADTHLTLTVGDTTETHVFEMDNLYAKCIQEFQNRIIHNDLSPSPMDDSIKNIAVLEAIRQSGLSKHMIQL